ncbi:MAG: hypothetical protein AAB874_03760 [Patescibacteria group bacterium]
MSDDPLYQKFMNRWEEVTELPTQQVGALTPLYKRTVRFFKVDPWRILMPASFVLAALVALVLQVTTVQIASFLQRGF